MLFSLIDRGLEDDDADIALAFALVGAFGGAAASV
jgi:hypothetical protein